MAAVGMAFCISSGSSASEPGMLTVDSLAHSPLVAPAGSAEFSFDDSQWWRGFNDPVLDTLVAIGLDHNYDVMSSVARLAQARATIDAARAGYYPTLSVSAGYTRSRESGSGAEMSMPQRPDISDWVSTLTGRSTFSGR